MTDSIPKPNIYDLVRDQLNPDQDYKDYLADARALVRLLPPKEQRELVVIARRKRHTFHTETALMTAIFTELDRNTDRQGGPFSARITPLPSTNRKHNQ